MFFLKNMVVALLASINIQKSQNEYRMILNFHKYQGTGNDFIMIDDLNKTFDGNNTDLISFLCDRKFGIGSDGILLLQASDTADFNVDFINPDGSRSFCGNGSRCAVRFAKDLGVIERECQFTAIDGLHHAKISGELIELKMSDVDEILCVGKDYFLNTGSPHHVVFVEDVNALDVVEKGKKIRYNDHYKKDGVNVNFVQRNDVGIYVRTYERGVENETLSCGTGVTAAALASTLTTEVDKNVIVQTLGGELSVNMINSENGFKDIWLCGPAKKIYEGTIEI